MGGKAAIVCAEALMRRERKTVVDFGRDGIRIEFVEHEGPQRRRLRWYHKVVWYLSWLTTGSAIANAIYVFRVL